MRNSFWLLGAVLLSACGPAGVISGKVTVEGGSASGIAVIVYGPQSGATVTGDESPPGTAPFSIGNLPDGKYVVRATLRGADVEEVNIPTTVTQGKATPEPVLTFRASTAKITGTVVMADGSAAENLTVTATGPEIRGARTVAGGSFTIDGIKNGAYVVSVEANDTREGRVAVGVNASGAINAGELRLTPVGRVAGTVLYNAMPVVGAPVVITGSNVSAVTDSLGKFQLINVPTGNQAVLVRVGTAPFFRSVTSMVQIARGANADLSLTLTDDAPKTGTVTGVVTFHGPRTPRDITVTAPGSGITGVVPQINGAYRLVLPVGVWDVMANAPQHPAKLLGRVTVVDGTTQALPGAEVSWWRPMWRSSSPITNPGNVTFGGQNETVPWSLVTFFDQSTGVPRLALVNSTTSDFRILAAGNNSGQRISRSGKYAGWFTAQTAFVYEIGTATLSTFSTLSSPATPVTRLEFATDESAIFIQRAGPTLSRVKFSNPGNVETFPSSGNALGIQLTNVDRWFVIETGSPGSTVLLVNPATQVAGVFTNVSSFSAFPTAWAITNCAVSCELWVQSPTSISPGIRDTSVSALPGGILSFNVYGFDNRGDYPCFTNAGQAFCVQSASGAHTALTAIPANFRLNEAGDRVIWTFVQGTNSVVREEVMPPTSSSNLGSNGSGVGWNIGWISPTRAYAYEGSGGPRNMHLVKSGVGVLDMDVGAAAINVRPPMIIFPGSATSQWRAIIGDGPMRMIPVATNIPVTAISVRPLGTGMLGVTKYGAMSFDTANTFIVDETGPTVRQVAAGYAGGVAARSGATEYFDMQRSGGNPSARALYLFNTNVLLEYNESNVTATNINLGIGNAGVLAHLGLGGDQQTIYVGGFQP